MYLSRILQSLKYGGAKKNQVQSWSMFPALHSNVSRLLLADKIRFDFHDDDDEKSCIKNYDTNVMGRFKCRNRLCHKTGWSSKKIPLTIRVYTKTEIPVGGTYNARVYHQRCDSCGHLSRPELDGSYADRVVYRLKKWSGLRVERAVYSGESNGPHLKHLCEGCKAGHCKDIDDGDF